MYLSLRKINYEYIIAAIALFIGLAVVLLIPNQIPGASWKDFGDMSSAVFFPILVGILLIVLGLIHFLSVLNIPCPQIGKVKDVRCFISVALLLVLYPVSIYLIGMTISSALVIFCGAIIFYYKNWLIIILSTIITPLAVYFLFEIVLRILLPKGILF